MVKVVSKIVEQFLPTTAKQGNQDFLTFWLFKDGRCHAFPARRAGAFAGDDPGLLYRHLSAARSCAEPGMGRDQEPQLPAQPARGLRAGHLDGLPGNGKRSSQHLAAATAGLHLLPHTDNFVFDGHQLSVAGGDDRRRVDPVLLLDLLAAAQPEAFPRAR